MRPEWKDFVGGKWENEVNVRDFIQRNYHPYDGDDSFLAAPTQNTKDLWDMVLDLQKKEREAGGVLDMDTKVVSHILHGVEADEPLGEHRKAERPLQDCRILP